MITKLWLVCNVLPLHASSSRHSLQMFDHTRHTWTASPLKCFQDDVCLLKKCLSVLQIAQRTHATRKTTCVCTFQRILWPCKRLHSDKILKMITMMMMMMTMMTKMMMMMIPVCVLMWVVRWSDRLNSRRQIRHWKGFWPGNTGYVYLYLVAIYFQLLQN